jgi:hypothetical protein
LPAYRGVKPGKLIALFAALGLMTGVTAMDISVTGVITDRQGSPLAGVNISFSVNSVSFRAVSATNGSYRLSIDGFYSSQPRLLELGRAFPVPFIEQVNIPFLTGSDGDILFSVYDMAGRKIREHTFRSVPAGSYRITWDGMSQTGQPAGAGIYVYALTLKGKTLAGRIVKADNIAGSGGMVLSPFIFLEPETSQQTVTGTGFEVTVTKTGYHTTRIPNMVVSSDTVIDFILDPQLSLPFKTTADHIAVNRAGNWYSLIIKGINLGASPPGFFPGEIAYAITPAMYEEWISMMSDAGFNSIRVYTLHPPVFYEKLAEHNRLNPEKALFLFQGIWLDEPEDPVSPTENILTNRIPAFTESIREVIDCMHGNKTISFRPGRAYGEYKTDISPWVAGFIIGREIIPYEVQLTNEAHPGLSGWTGNYLNITGATASELFAAKMLDETLSYEYGSYASRRPVSMSSWPTLDPLTHPTETHTDEDVAHIDIMKIEQASGEELLFASYHAYPYYPDFVSDDPVYRTYSDEQGPNSYAGYLNDLRNYYDGIPLIIAEFGVPSSWGNAHNSYSGMPHGGLSEKQQGESNIRLLKNIINAGCGGGFMFAWMDEWFKSTWIVQYLEAYGFVSGSNLVPTRQLWHNLVSPEQNFGLITFDPAGASEWYDFAVTSPGVTGIRAAHDNSFLFIEINTGYEAADGDTLLLAIDTYLMDTGEGMLPGGIPLQNRSEFLLEAVKGADTVALHVTEAYNMFGLTPRFNLADHSVQKFRSTVTDGAPWIPTKWINNGFDSTIFELGRIPAESTGIFTPGERTALTWSGSKVTIRLPWTFLYFHDPTQGRVIDGAESYDGGYNFTIFSRNSDGIALSVMLDDKLTSTTSRYTWPPWLTVPQTSGREKESLSIIAGGLRYISGYAN